jgi:hypothetical protein
MTKQPETSRPIERSRLNLLMLLAGAGATTACLGGPGGTYSGPARAPATTNDNDHAGGEGGGGGDGGGH